MKPSEIREKTDEQLEALKMKTLKEIFDLRKKAVTAQLDNPAKIRLLRKDVARIETEKTARKLQAK